MTISFRPALLAAALIPALAAAGCSPDRPGDGPRTEVTRDQVDQGLESLGLRGQERMVWEDMEIEDGVAVFAGLSPADGETAGRVGRLSIAAPRVEDGMTRFDALEAEELVVGEGDEVTRIARLFADRPGPGLSQWLADVMAGRTDDSDYAPPSRRAADYSFAELSMSGMTVTADGSDDKSGGSVDGAIERLALEDFDGERMGRAVLEGVRFESSDGMGEPMVLALDALSLSGVDAGFVDLIINADLLEDDAELTDRMVNAMSGWMQPTGVFEAITMSGLRVQASGIDFSIPSLDMNQTVRRDGRVEMVQDIPLVRLAFSPDSPQSAEAAGMLAMLGYDALEMSVRGRGLYDPAADRYVLAREENVLEIRDGLVLKTGYDVTGLQAYADETARLMRQLADEGEGGAEPDLDAMNEQMMAAYSTLILNSASIVIEDRDLLERLMAFNAQTQGVSPEEARMQAATMLSLGIAMAGGALPQGLTLEVGSALGAFISEGGAIEITMAPDAPVNMGRLMNVPEDMSVLADLGLSVRHIPAQ
ncbi:MAG: hypothetical protein JJU18_08940 [Oceanicaulis sp.]|nr:hypothetical protein [Oceanicaulis sp.]